MAADRPVPGGAAAPRVSYVFGARNSAGVVAETVRAIAGHLVGTASEIVVAENGSTDGTHEVLGQLKGEWAYPWTVFTFTRTAPGLGNALRAAIPLTTGDLVVLTADDLPFGFDDLDGLRRTGVDMASQLVAIGSKAHPMSRVHRSLLRDTLTGGFRVLRRGVLGMRTGDPQGTYLVHGRWLRRLAPALREPGFLFATEIAYAAELVGVRPLELPVRLYRNPAQRSRVRPSDVTAMAAGLFRLRAQRDALRRAARP